MPDKAATEKSRAIWEGVSEAWDTYDDRIQEMSRDATDWLLANLATDDGVVVLELAAGAGQLTLRISELVGASGKVISTDFADGMVDVLRSRTSGAPNIEVRKMDAQEIDLPPDSVDVVAIRFGLMLIPDVAAALAGCRRVLRPGGTLGAIVTGSPEANMWFTALGIAAGEEGVIPPIDPFEPGAMFSLSDPKVLETELADAGFEEIRIESVPLRQNFESFDAFWDLQSHVSGPLAMALRNADEAKIRAVRERLEGIVAPFRNEDGTYSFTGQVNGVIAR